MAKDLNIGRLAPMGHIYRFYPRGDFFASAAELGFRQVDLWTCGTHYLLEPDFRADVGPLRDELRGYGLTAACVTPEQTCPRPYQMAAREPALRARTERYWRNAVLTAHDLACDKVLITSGWGFYSEPREDAFRRAEDMVGSLCAFAEGYGVCLCMETLSPQSTNLVNTLDDLSRMERAVASPSFAVTMDIDTVLNAGEDVQAYFDRFGSRVLLCHFMDNKPGFLGHLAWGDGESDPGKLLETFAANGYTGPFSLEYTLPKYFRDPHAVYAKTMNILKPYFQA